MDTLSYMRRFGTFAFVAILQILFLNRIALFGYVTPLFYIWMIARFDNYMKRTGMLLWAFFLGLVLDIFSGTPGLNAASATLLAMFQPAILKLFVSVERHDQLFPGSASMGGHQFAGYLLLLTVLHHTVYFILRSIPLADWSVLVLKVVFSSLATFLFMIVADYVTKSSASKR
jgi:rod shape-determining protein MreD